MNIVSSSSTYTQSRWTMLCISQYIQCVRTYVCTTRPQTEACVRKNVIQLEKELTLCMCSTFCLLNSCDSYMFCKFQTSITLHHLSRFYYFKVYFGVRVLSNHTIILATNSPRSTTPTIITFRLYLQLIQEVHWYNCSCTSSLARSQMISLIGSRSFGAQCLIVLVNM